MGGKNPGEALTLKKRKGARAFFFEFYKNKTLYIMLLPAVAFVAIFNYAPLYGLQIAFKNFNYSKGIWGSPWVGFANFLQFFRSTFFLETTGNTLWLNFLFITFSMIFAVSTAILLNEVTRKQRRVFLTAMFFPYFISWIVISEFVNAMLSAKYGLVNNVISLFGTSPIAWYGTAKYWPAILTIACVWQGLGYGSVIYLAQIVGFDQEVYEAAKIDGANKWQEIRRVTFPMLVPTITFMLLMAVGSIFRSNVQMIFAIIGNNPQTSGILYPTTDVIDTFILRAVTNNGSLAEGTAVGLCQSIIGFALVLGSNWLVKRRNPDNALF